MYPGAEGCILRNLAGLAGNMLTCTALSLGVSSWMLSLTSRMRRYFKSSQKWRGNCLADLFDGLKMIDSVNLQALIQPRAERFLVLFKF